MLVPVTLYMLKYYGSTTNLALHLKSQHLQEFLKVGFGSVAQHPKAIEQKQPHSQGQLKVTDVFVQPRPIYRTA